jgi:hypothetical protein
MQEMAERIIAMRAQLVHELVALGQPLAKWSVRDACSCLERVEGAAIHASGAAVYEMVTRDRDSNS